MPFTAKRAIRNLCRRSGRRCAAGLCPVCTANRRHEPPYWGAGVEGAGGAFDENPCEATSKNAGPGGFPTAFDTKSGAPAAQAPPGAPPAGGWRAEVVAPHVVGTSYGSLASPQAAKLVPSTVPPLPTEPASLGFGGGPVIGFVTGAAAPRAARIGITRQALTAAALYRLGPPGRRRCHAAERSWWLWRHTAHSESAPPVGRGLAPAGADEGLRVQRTGIYIQ